MAENPPSTISSDPVTKLEALEARKEKKPLNAREIALATEIQIKKETKNLYKTASKDILKDKYLEEAKRRVMMDLFS